MVSVYPFTGLCPSPDAFRSVPSVPYDVISREDAAAEIKANDKSFLRVIRPDAELLDLDPHDDRIYARAAEMFAKMKTDGLFVEDDSPSFYIYQITLNGEVFTGLVTCVSVAEYKDNIIKKHELTRYDKEEDRTRHIDAVSAHTGQVFLLYKDPGKIQETLSRIAASHTPVGEYVSAGGNLHRLFRAGDPAEVREITDLFAGIPNLYIADGHHRAKSSANVMDRRISEGRATPDAEKFMSVLFAHDSVRIYGYHRLIRDLAGMNADQFLGDLGLRFTITPLKKVDISKNTIPVKNDGSMHIMHLYVESEWYELTRPVDPKADVISRLDVSVLQQIVLDDMLAIMDPRGDPRISFVGGIVPLSEVIKEVDNGEYSAAFIMQPVTAQGVIDVADAGLIMPPKSTWFEPKLLSGMVIHEIR
ncbi:MAG TPA: DUF1015 family protein [Methanocorpusculum sp.]|nr:DUF1015 family protein [Methanocorpusculum sp.]